MISSPWYKGVDLVLKTADLLKRFTNFDFEWCVYGVNDIRFYEYKYHICASAVGVRIMGIASKEELIDALCSSTLYVHPSYIDNSPNSVCEAQILGVPVIATNVGGISSLVDDTKTGFLVPANDPYKTAYLINQLCNNFILLENISRNAIKCALDRHNPIIITNTLINIYNEIIKCNLSLK